jgi:hypothetical protein
MRMVFHSYIPLVAVAVAIFLSGCWSECNPDDSQLPWSRPGKWEGANSFTAAKTPRS